jgi:hypothetical protein
MRSLAILRYRRSIRQAVNEKSEQGGFANLAKDTFGMFRNPTAHALRNHWPIGDQVRDSI